MSQTFTDHLTPVGMTTYERDTSVDFGNRFYMRIPNDFANLLSQNVGADVTYDEWQGRDGKTRYTITAVNGQNCRRPRGGGQQQQRPQGGGGPAARAQTRPAGGPASQAQQAGGGKSYEGAWAGMGPENRAAQACLHYLEAKAGIKEWDHGGMDALAVELNIVKQAWLRGVEGRGMPPAAGNSQMHDERNPPDDVPLDDEVPF